MVDTINRSPVLNEPSLMPPSGLRGDIPLSHMGDAVLRTPAGNVRSMQAPPLPLAPGFGAGAAAAYGNNYTGYGNNYAGYGSGGFGSSFLGSLGNYGGYGGGGGYGSGYGGYSGYGGGFGGYGGYNRFGMGGGGMNPMDPEARFVQLAEASSRPAFESIESLVSAIGNIASMLDSTFFALTSSFRAILGVAANFGRLRGVFSQFWQTFAIFRGITWMYRKILYWLRISDMDPSSQKFKKAFAEAINETAAQQGAPKLPRKGHSPWPVLAFLSFIFTAPYLIMKLLGTVSNTAQEEARNPSKWINPIESVALYDFQARNPSELTITNGQRIVIAPKEIQNTLGLLNTGWAMATMDNKNSGIIPINYVKSPQQLRQEQQQLKQPVINLPEMQQQYAQTVASSPAHAMYANDPIAVQQPELMNLSSAAFAAPPTSLHQQQLTNNMILDDFDIAPQPIGPPNIVDIASQNDF